MDTVSYWQDSATFPVFPKPTRDVEVEVIVVGGGLAGITTAYLMKKAGRTVALLERGRCAQIDTGHTTAHLTAMPDMRLHELIRNFGKPAARDVWDAGLAAIDQIAAIVEKKNIDCDFSRQDGFLHAPAGTAATSEIIEELKREIRAAEELGIPAHYEESIPFFNVPGVRFPGQARFHPLRYLSALVSKIPGGGSHVFENTEAGEITDDPLTVTANGHRISGRYLVLATHTPLQGVTGTLGALLFQTKLSLYTSYAIGARVSADAVPDALFWDTKDPYDYLRIEPQSNGFSYVIFGGEDHKTGQETDTRLPYGRLEERLYRLMPSAKVEHRWSGQVIETNDGLPFIGEVAKNQFISTGFAGNGMTFGTLAAMMATDAFLGLDNRWKKLFDPGRHKWLGGTWTYLAENKDYPYHLLKDWLTKGAHESLSSIPRKSGKVILVDGRKVAASRDQTGEITLCSAVCPHLGCIVDWNHAEQTWDCPCHGSRFKPAGEVISGPAESPLEKIAAADIET
jgi:glycine/D-amino acid oxidase-like deaminating enzyme/nitrite reductase/ring-hydroxylating ferredoxin subunit